MKNELIKIKNKSFEIVDIFCKVNKLKEPYLCRTLSFLDFRDNDIYVQWPNYSENDILPMDYSHVTIPYEMLDWDNSTIEAHFIQNPYEGQTN